MDGQVIVLGHRRQRVQILKAIKVAVFGDLGDRHGAALRAVNAAYLFTFDGGAQGVWGHAVAARNQRQLAAAHVKFRRVAFIDVDMCQGRAKHRLERLAIGGQGDAVCGCACCHQIDGGVGRFEQVADAVLDAGCQIIAAIARNIAFVRTCQRLKRFGVEGAGVVRCKVHCAFLGS